jgi:hypothetical protein
MNIACLRNVAFSLVVLLVVRVQAEPVTNYLPDNALGFVLIRNLAQANAKIERVTKIFAEVSPMPIPAPLPVLKAATGLGDGINEQGDALLALLPGVREAPNHRPLLLVPVSDYSAFAASIGGDASGEICRIAIAGEEVLAARLGDYAVLMNVEHRDVLESIIAATPRAVGSLEPLAKWTPQMDVSLVLTPSGLKSLTAMGRPDPARRRAEQQPSEAHFADTFGQFSSTLGVYQEILDFLGVELEAMALGVAIDDEANLEVHTRAVLADGGELAKLASAASSKISPLEGYRDEAFVFAAGGPIPPEHAELSSSFAARFLRAHPESYGFEELTEDEWQQVQEAWQSAMKGVRSLSMMMLPGGAEDPLYSNIYAVIEVDDAAAYLKSYAESMVVWNKLLSRTTTGINLHYETTETELAGKKGLLLTADLSEVANDPNVPMMKPLMEAMLGKDGKMLIYLIAANDTTVYMGVAEQDDVAARMDDVLKQEKGLTQSSDVEATLSLLNPQSGWVGIISPQGSVAWFTRLLGIFMAQFGQAPPAIPEFPQSPPLGFALSIDDDCVSTEMVCPVDTLKAAAVYLKKIQDAF